jgi:hypothetical protein
LRETDAGAVRVAERAEAHFAAAAVERVAIEPRPRTAFALLEIEAGRARDSVDPRLRDSRPAPPC